MNYNSLRRVQRLTVSAAKAAMEYGKAHPYQRAFTVVGVGLTSILGLGWTTKGLLKLIGFGPQGPIAGEQGSAAMSMAICD